MFWNNKKAETPQDLDRMIAIKKAELQCLKDQERAIQQRVEYLESMKGGRRFAHDVFKEHFEKRMNGSFYQFQQSHKTLYECILDSISDAVAQCEVTWKRHLDQVRTESNP